MASKKKSVSASGAVSKQVRTVYAIKQNRQTGAAELWSTTVEVREKTVRFLQKDKPHAFGWGKTQALDETYFTRHDATNAWRAAQQRAIDKLEDERLAAARRLNAKIIDRTNEGH